MHNRYEQIMSHRPRRFDPGKFHFYTGSLEKPDDNGKLPITVFFFEHNDLVLSLFIERAARLQLLARAAGEIRKIEPDIAKAAHDYRLQPEPIGATFHYLARQVLKTESECLD